MAVGRDGAILSSRVADLPCGGFADVPAGHPACTATARLAVRDVVNGLPDGAFHPDRPVTRAEFAKMLVLTLNRNPDPAVPLPFPDTAGHWAATGGYLQAAMEMKAINGFPDGTFRPDAPATRAEVVKMAAAATGLSGTEASPYEDVGPEDWFARWVGVAHSGRLIGPEAPFPVWTGAALGGNEPVTRTEAAMVLANLPGG